MDFNKKSIARRLVSIGYWTPLEKKMLKRGLRPLSTARQFSVQAAPSSNNTEVEWKDAKPFKEIPRPGLSFIFKMLPGGELHNTSIVKLHRYFHETFGNIAFFKGMFGGPDFLFTYDPNDFAKVFRTEGKWPQRVPMQTMDYYRNHLRKDVYKKNGLLGNDGEQWQEFRTAVNPVLMQPKTVELYIEQIDQVTRDLVEIVKKARDDKNETPADFSSYIERWSLESIGTIALDTRLGVLQPSTNNKGDRLAFLMDQMFELSFKLEVMPSPWRYFATPKFIKLMKIFDEATK